MLDLLVNIGISILIELGAAVALLLVYVLVLLIAFGWRTAREEIKRKKKED